jgi:hypothetical protein
VTGPEAGQGDGKIVSRSNQAGGATHVEVRSGTASSGLARMSVLTIRVKKSDAEAFAKGKTTLDEFRRKAKILIYSGSDVAANGEGPDFRLWSSTPSPDEDEAR